MKSAPIVMKKRHAIKSLLSDMKPFLLVEALTESDLCMVHQLLQLGRKRQKLPSIMSQRLYRSSIAQCLPANNKFKRKSSLDVRLPASNTGRRDMPLIGLLALMVALLQVLTMPSSFCIRVQMKLALPL